MYIRIIPRLNFIKN